MTLKPAVFAMVAALVAAGAVVNGAVTQRWAAFQDDPAVVERLHGLTVRFDDWTAEPVPTEMPRSERCTATSRRYTSPRTGRGAAVSIFTGIPGAVSTHTPDVCYPGSGYRTLRAAKKETIALADGKTVECYVADFEKKKETKVERARVRWAWSTDGTWVAPDSPRWQFVRRLSAVPVLYKLYVVTPVPEATGDDRPEDDPVTAAFVRTAWAQFAEACAK